MQVIEFFVPGVARGRDERSHRGGKGGVYVHTTPEGRAWREAIWAQAIQRRPDEPWEGPVSMTLIFVRERPTSHHLRGDRTRELSALGCRTPRPTARPDLGNCEKPVEDALKRARYYRDDSQVVSRHGAKKWCGPGEEPGVYVTVRFEGPSAEAANSPVLGGTEAPGRDAGRNPGETPAPVLKAPQNAAYRARRRNDDGHIPRGRPADEARDAPRGHLAAAPGGEGRQDTSPAR